MATVNEELVDEQVRHLVYLVRYSTTVARRMIAILNRADKDVVGRLADLRLSDPTDSALLSLELVLSQIRATRAGLFEEIRRELEGEVLEFGAYEVSYQARVLRDAVAWPQILSVVSPPTAQVAAAALARPFQGRYLREWVMGLEAGAAARLRDAVRMAFVEGQTTDQLVRTVRGTKVNDYNDGILQGTRRGVEALVRTAITHTANHARDAVYAANQDIVKAVRWVSTLDGRTTAICRARDGMVFPVGKGPRPPAHVNCRSTTAPVTKSWRELGLDFEDLPPETRASMNGQVPATETYDSWLRKQPKEFQDDVLGDAKARLFRNGATLDKFVDMRSGREFTLRELRAKHPEWF